MRDQHFRQPSARYCFDGSPVRFLIGSTAIDRPGGSAAAGADERATSASGKASTAAVGIAAHQPTRTARSRPAPARASPRAPTARPPPRRALGGVAIDRPRDQLEQTLPAVRADARERARLAFLMRPPHFAERLAVHRELRRTPGNTAARRGCRCRSPWSRPRPAGTAPAPCSAACPRRRQLIARRALPARGGPRRDPSARRGRRFRARRSAP